jgi:hypothetical protein
MRAPDNPKALLPDRGEIEKFVDAIFRNAKMEGFVSLRAFYQKDAGKPFRITPIEIGKLNGPSKDLTFDAATVRRVAEAACEEARRAAQEPKPVNFCPPLAVFNNRKHAREEDISQGLVISVEADSRPAAACVRLESILGAATVVVASGGFWTNPKSGEVEGKFHLHWRWAVPATDKETLAKLKQARTLASAIVGGDPSNNPISHPMRWPGGWHRKAEPRLARIILLRDCNIDLDQALAKLMEVAPQKDKGRQHQSSWLKSDPKLVAIAIKYIPNDWEDDAESWNEWNRFGMAIFGATDGSKEGHKIFHIYSQKSKQNRYDEAKTDKRWESYYKSPPKRIGAGTLFHYAYKANPHWRDEFDRVIEARFLAKPPIPETEDVPPPKEKEPSDAQPDKEPKAETKTEKPKEKEFDPLFDPWAKFVVPNFPLDVPEGLRSFIAERSAVIGCDPSGLAMAVLTACSGALDHRFKLKMMKHGSWYAAPRLWTLLVGDPSD